MINPGFGAESSGEFELAEGGEARVLDAFAGVPVNTPMFIAWLARLLLATTFLMILLGGMVHTRGASLACPDWPLCYGMVMPPMHGDIALEHGHRLLGTFIGVLTLALLAATFTLDPQVRPRLRRWAALGVALVIFQGTLGGLTVLYRLPPPISIAHFGTSLLFLAWAVQVTVLFGRNAESYPNVALARVTGAREVLEYRGWVLGAAGLVYLQSLLGSAVRHTHASLSCGTEALRCAGSWLPSNGPQWLQTSHRLTALLATVVVVAATVPAMRAARLQQRAGVRPLAIASHLLIVLQVVLGVLTLQTGIHFHVVMTHLATGALLWAVLVGMAAKMAAPLPAGQVH